MGHREDPEYVSVAVDVHVGAGAPRVGGQDPVVKVLQGSGQSNNWNTFLEGKKVHILKKTKKTSSC